MLEADPIHDEAAVALASILMEAGDTEAALAVLEPVPSSVGVDRVRAAARLGGAVDSSVGDLESRLAEDPDNDETRLDLAKALIAGQHYERGLDLLLEVVSRKEDYSDDARATMIDVFELLGPESPITQEYRRRLANALF